MVEHIKQHLPIPAIVIVGEPTDMTVVNAHKSGHRFRTEVTGLEGHSSLPQRGVNSIMVAGELLAEVNRIAEDMKSDPGCDHRFDPPYTSIHVGMIQGRNGTSTSSPSNVRLIGRHVVCPVLTQMK